MNFLLSNFSYFLFYCLIHFLIILLYFLIHSLFKNLIFSCESKKKIVKSRARAVAVLFHLEPNQSSDQPTCAPLALWQLKGTFRSRLLPQHCFTMEYAQKHANSVSWCSKLFQATASKTSHSSYQPQSLYSERSGGAANKVQTQPSRGFTEPKVFRKDSCKSAWLLSYQESNELLHQLFILKRTCRWSFCPFFGSAGH